jgi:hypothetical protein
VADSVVPAGAGPGVVSEVLTDRAKPVEQATDTVTQQGAGPGVFTETVTERVKSGDRAVDEVPLPVSAAGRALDQAVSEVIPSGYVPPTTGVDMGVALARARDEVIESVRQTVIYEIALDLVEARSEYLGFRVTPAVVDDVVTTSPRTRVLLTTEIMYVAKSRLAVYFGHARQSGYKPGRR